MEEEIWKDIPNYEGLYQVSNLGRVKRLNSIINLNSKNQHCSFKTTKYYKEKILKNINCNNYLRVTLCKDNIKKIKQVHRLVAKSFLDNYNDELEVNHIDENTLNNCADNLEMCTSKYNCNYGTRNKHISDKHKKSILQYTTDGMFLKKWNSISEASEYYNVSISSITQCLKHKHKTSRNYIWRYESEVVNNAL